MTKPRNGMLTALDVGTSKIACLVAETGAQGEVRVMGVGHHASGGVQAGAIVNMEAAESAILTAVSAAEERVGERLQSVVINVSAGHPDSSNLSVEVEIDGHEVGDADLRRVYSHGLERNGHDDRELVHCIPIAHHIDGSRGIKDPRGMYGQRLSVDMHLVSADAAALRNMVTCVARCHLDVEDVVVSPYAAGLACLVEDEIDLGATVVDMGGGTTTVAVFYGGHVVHAQVVPIGGDHVTRDIARGLTTALVHAERIKVLYGSALPSPSDDQALIDVPLVGEEDRNQPNHVPRSLVVGIIRPRLEEIFERVRACLDESPTATLAGHRLVLTGGASQLAGAAEVGALVLNKKVRLGRPILIAGLADAVSGPAFSTAAGLLRFAAQRRGESDIAIRGTAERTGRLGRLGQWLKESI
ncbi:MAG: cell division protein FtsA [Defluviicoccus sp.]|nr:cell division protein FtsA [Defluviicoccus sp.]MDE0385396.1 cell division protein FtsA [Defluviicoccus sp.]